MKRIEILAGMAAKRPDDVVREVWEGRRERERAREVLPSFEEARSGAGTAGSDGPPRSVPGRAGSPPDLAGPGPATAPGKAP